MDGTRHPILGRHFKSPHPEETHFWELTLDKSALPYLDDHRIEGAAVLPASAFVEMALAAAVEVFASKSFLMKDIEFHKALFLPDGVTQTIQVILSPGTDGVSYFHIYSCRGDAPQAGGSWTLHANGNICPQHDSKVASFSEQAVLEEIQARCPERISGQDYYLRLRENGIHYGSFFQSITQLWRHDADLLGEVEVSEEPDAKLNSYLLHPAILDACVQVVGAAIPVEPARNGNRSIYMPTRIDQIRVQGRPRLHLWSHARLQEQDTDTIKADVRLLDETGHVAVEILGLRFDNLGRDTKHAAEDNLDDWLYEFEWQSRERPNGQPAPEAPAPVSRDSWLIFADGSTAQRKRIPEHPCHSRRIVRAHG
jgi:acyl transferase domain-containing protein